MHNITKKELQRILNENRKCWNNKNGKRNDLLSADLERANLEGIDLQDFNLKNIKFQYANLQNANLKNTNLQYANFQYANLKNANLRNSNLQYANFQNADLQGTRIDYKIKRKFVSNKILMNKMFQKTKKCWLCYKIFDNYYKYPKKWQIEKGKIIKEKVDTNRFILESYGINVGIREWFRCKEGIWLVEVPFITEICVPYWTNGIARVGEAKLIKQLI